MVSRWVSDRRDIIWVDCNPSAGREMKDIHPLLVLSPRAFNDRTSIVVGLPMSTKTYNATNPFAVAMLGPKNEVGYILTNQPKSFDWRQRGGKAHPWKQASAEVFELACDGLNQIIAICK